MLNKNEWLSFLFPTDTHDTIDHNQKEEENNSFQMISQIEKLQSKLVCLLFFPFFPFFFPLFFLSKHSNIFCFCFCFSFFFSFSFSFSSSFSEIL